MPNHGSHRSHANRTQRPDQNIRPPELTACHDAHLIGLVEPGTAKPFSHPFSGNKTTGKISRRTTSEVGNATDSGGIQPPRLTVTAVKTSLTCREDHHLRPHWDSDALRHGAVTVLTPGDGSDQHASIGGCLEKANHGSGGWRVPLASRHSGIDRLELFLFFPVCNGHSRRRGLCPDGRGLRTTTPN